MIVLNCRGEQKLEYGWNIKLKKFRFIYKNSIDYDLIQILKYSEIDTEARASNEFLSITIYNWIK